MTLESKLSAACTMEAPVAASSPKLSNLVRAIYEEKCVAKGLGRERPFFWNAELFGLHKVDAYNSLPPPVQEALLGFLTNHNLNESYYIEKVGISYAGKMILLSENEEERLLYCSIAQDEAAHLSEVKRFLAGGTEETYRGNSFLHFIAQVVEKGAPKICQSVLQVALEGYGISFYTALRNACLDEGYKKVLTRILADEASHHGSGVIFAAQAEFSSAEAAELETYLGTLASFMSCHSFPIVMVLEKMHGGFSAEQRRRVFEQLDVAVTNRDKSASLARLMHVAKLDRVLSPALLSSMQSGWGLDQTVHVYQGMLSGAAV